VSRVVRSGAFRLLALGSGSTRLPRQPFGQMLAHQLAISPRPPRLSQSRRPDHRPSLPLRLFLVPAARAQVLGQCALAITDRIQVASSGRGCEEAGRTSPALVRAGPWSYSCGRQTPCRRSFVPVSDAPSAIWTVRSSNRG